MFSSTAAALSARYLAAGLVGENPDAPASASVAAAAGLSQAQAAVAEAGKASGSASGVGIGGLPLQTSATPAPIDPRAIKLQAVRDEGMSPHAPRLASCRAGPGHTVLY